jgi:hypothetical protein
MTRPSPTAEPHALRRLLDAAEQSADPRLSMVYDAYEALRPRIQNAPLPDNELDLEGILGESTRRLFGCEEVTVTEVVWSRAEGAPFIHGAFKAHDRAASFLFFEDRNAPQLREHRIASDNAHTLLGTIYLPRGRLVVDSSKPVAAKSAFTIITGSEM